MSDLDMTDPAALANEYLDLARRIEDMTEVQARIKDNLKTLIPKPAVDSELSVSKCTFGDAIVQWVKGRHSEKLDEKKLRKTLALAGVDLEIIEGAFEAATTKSVGEPSLRVSRKE